MIELNEWMGRWINGRMDGCMGWVQRWIDGWMGVDYVNNWQEMLNMQEEQVAKQSYLILWNDWGDNRKVTQLW